jgi:hypothetical protein
MESSYDTPIDWQMVMEREYKDMGIVDRPRVVRVGENEFALRSVQVPSPCTGDASRDQRYVWLKKGKGDSAQWKRVELDDN